MEDDVRWRLELERTRELGEIELLVLDGDTFVSRSIKYDQGPRYPVLVAQPKPPALLL